MESHDDVAAQLIEWAERDAAIGREAAAAAEGPRIEHLAARCAQLESALADREREVERLRAAVDAANRSPLRRVLARVRSTGARS